MIKTKLVLGIMLTILLAFGTGLMAETVQIGSGSAETKYLPIRFYYCYTYSQQIYTQSQINTAGTITKIRFYLDTGTGTSSTDWTIYLGHTSKSSFSSNSDWIDVSSLTEVFSGTVTYPAAGNWMEITLDSSFNYNNSDNLVVAVDENESGYGGSSESWGAFTSSANTGIYYSNDWTNPDPNSPPSASSRTGELSQIQFEISTPMSFESSTTETASTDPVFKGFTENPIVRLKVVTSGELSPFDATSVSFNTNGTTNTSDITNAKVFYTTSTTFSNFTQFGSTNGTPSGSMTFTGTQTLSEGNNYFWLTYDIPTAANIGNVVDGECSSVTVDGTARTPDVQAPAGSRTINAPYQIATTEDLIELSNTPGDWGAHFIQTADIAFNADKTQVDWDGDGTATWDTEDQKGFSPIGNSATYFTGTYNGNEHIISNLYISRVSMFQGLFGYASNAQIEKLGMVDASIYGGDYTGTFAGRASGTVISECFAKGNVTAYTSEFIGGLVGESSSSGTITNCYSQVTIGADVKVGGICGGNTFGSEINKCYHTGEITASGGADIYALAGNLEESGPITDSYWDVETTGLDYQPVGGSGKTTREMHMQGTYTNWDFMEETSNGSEDIWGNNPVCNDGYPFISWQGHGHYADTPEGSGEEENPYQISTLEHLYWLAQNSPDWDKYYEQSQNIDVSTAASWYNDAGFLPIGNQNNGFTGHYDGQNHTINNLTIDRSTYYVGLFGLADEATVEYLGLTDVNITGNDSTGSLVGGIIGSSSLINFCYSTGTINGSDIIGGLIGYNESTVKNCYNEATVNGHHTVGGLMGSNYGTVQYCYNSGSINGSSEYVGGLIGVSSEAVENCYNTGPVDGFGYVGGLIGSGYSEDGYTALNCYSTGAVTCSGSDAGGVMAWSWPDAVACFWDTQTSGQSSSDGDCIGRTTLEMQMEFKYVGHYSWQTWDFMEETDNGSDDVWGLNPLENNGYPFLSWQGYDHYSDQPEGSGTEEAPYIVSGLPELYWISQKTDRWDDHYQQSCSIDATSTELWCNGAGFIPLGISDANYFFSGNYAGQGYTIDNLKINRPTVDNVGLFGKFESGEISNLGLTSLYFKANSKIGGLAGITDILPPINNCFTTGTIIGNGDYIGGIIGSVVGGVDITNCYSHVDVKGEDYVGGLIGAMSNSFVTNCYSTGFVFGYNYTGGLIGDGANWVDNSFWDTETSGQDNSSAGTGKTTAEMTTLSTFTNAGWDFFGETANGSDDYWDMDESGEVEDGYPFLGYQETPMDWTGAVSSDWNDAGNWSKSLGVPNQHKDITIDATKSHDPEIPSDGASINDLTVNNGATLTIGDGGSLITYGDITNNGTITIKRSITDGEWHLVSSPISGATANIFLGDYLRSWDEPGGQWTEVTDENTALSPAQGYLLWGVAKATTHTFTGTPNTGEQSISLTTGGGGDQQGFNLVGNPYPSSIDWSVLDDTYGAVYYYDAANSHYDTWNNGSGTNGGQQYLPPGQGFFVYTDGTETSFTVDNTARVHDNATSFYKNAPKDEANELRLVSSGAEGKTDETLIIFDETAQAGFEAQTDAWKMFSGTEGLGEIYTLPNEKALAIDRRPLENIIQLGFTAPSEGEYSLSLNGETKLPKVELEDTQEEVFHNLKESAYAFDWEPADSETRFKLHLSTVGMEEQEAEEPFRVYAANQQLYIQSELRGEIQVRLLDITGRLLMHRQVSGSGAITMPTSLQTGIYLVEVMQNQKSSAQKIYINQ